MVVINSAPKNNSNNNKYLNKTKENNKTMGDDRSALFDQIKKFRHKGLKPVEIKVIDGSGKQRTEKRGVKGMQTLSNDGIKGPGYVVDTKPDLQVGMIVPGLLIASQDVANDKTLLQQYGITHILNLAYGVENTFEDDFNYHKLDILDTPETDITKYFNECFDFIDEGIQRGNCLVHCNAGVSRSTAICCGYLMKKQNIRYPEALSLVREARAFARPNDGFAKQLENYSDVLLGQFDAPDTTEDAFVAKKKAEREAERAKIAGSVSIKDRLKDFGATISKVYECRLDSITPIRLPLKKKTNPTAQNSQPASNSTISSPSSLLNFKSPPPPPPPPPPIASKTIPTPPPPPGALKTTVPPPPPPPNELATKKKGFPPPMVDNKYEGPKSLNPNVDETQISVAAQKKLWDSNLQNSVPKVQTIPATPNVAKTRFQWQQQNNIGTPTTPSSSPTPPRAISRSPEPEKKVASKKIILKPRRDSNVSVSSDSEAPTRRSTRDLIEALEASSNNNSNTNSPLNSPNIARKQHSYGRKTPTSQLANESRNASPIPPLPVAAKKPTWGLRDTVETTSKESSPSPLSGRGSSLSSSRGVSPAPSVESEGTQSAKQVFGRVPPRKVSLSGSVQTQNNELPVVPAASTGVTSNKQNSTLSSTTSKTSKTGGLRERVDDASKKYAQTEKFTVESMPGASSKKNQTNKSEKEVDDGEKNSSEDVRSGFKKTPLAETKKKPSINKSMERRKSSGLNRSSTLEILKLIKTKSRHDFGLSMDRVEEDVEIEYLLAELENEGIENIDWENIGVDEGEVMNIVEQNRDEEDDDEEDSSEKSSSSEESSSSDDEEDDMKHTVFSTPSTASATMAKTTPKQATNTHTSAMSIKLAPVQPQTNKSLNFEECSSSEEGDSSEEETESE